MVTLAIAGNDTSPESLDSAGVAEIIYDLSHTAAGAPENGFRRFVNYRDMSVQQLGSIYERLLERETLPRPGWHG